MAQKGENQCCDVVNTGEVPGALGSFRGGFAGTQVSALLFYSPVVVFLVSVHFHFSVCLLTLHKLKSGLLSGPCEKSWSDEVMP